MVERPHLTLVAADENSEGRLFRLITDPVVIFVVTLFLGPRHKIANEFFSFLMSLAIGTFAGSLAFLAALSVYVSEIGVFGQVQGYLLSDVFSAGLGSLRMAPV